MDGDWAIVEIGSVANIYDGPHATPPMSEDGPIFLGIDSLENGRLNTAGVRHISEDVFLDWTRRVVPTGGDLVFSYETRIGQAALIPNGLRCCLGRRLALVRPKSDALNIRYFLYYFLSPVFQEHLRANTKPGSTVDRIHLNDFPNFPVALPPRRYQDEIAELLGALDDKIELNRRTAETLETIAQALFKSWFVDFDPVNARAVGQPTGLADDLAALFPDSFDADCPTGWSFSLLREQFRVLSGGTPSRSEAAYWGGEIPWVTPRTMTSSHVSDAPDRVTPAAIGNGTRIAPTGAIFVMVRGMGLHQGVRVSQAKRDLAFNQDVKALISRGLDENFLLYALLDYAPVLHTKVLAAGHGTGVLPTDALDAVRITVPPASVRERLFSPFRTINERVALARDESTTLASLRDTILPKLISGELHIADVRSKIAAA